MGAVGTFQPWTSQNGVVDVQLRQIGRIEKMSARVPKVEWRHLATREAALQAIGEAFDCKHLHQNIVRRTLRGGSTAIVRQCADCGDALPNPIKKSSIGGNEESLPQFDGCLGEAWRDARQREVAEALEFFRTAAKASHREYLKSAVWARKRAAVMKRANGICEGCLEAPATAVHHLDYSHLGDELLWELVAVCDSCHGRAHADDDDGFSRK